MFATVTLYATRHMSPFKTSPVNIICWVLAVSGAVAFLASAVAVAYLLVLRDARLVTEEHSLHDTYYVIKDPKMIIWPMLLCMILSSAVALIGYVCTDRFMMRTARHYLHSTSQD